MAAPFGERARSTRRRRAAVGHAGTMCAPSGGARSSAERVLLWGVSWRHGALWRRRHPLGCRGRPTRRIEWRCVAHEHPGPPSGRRWERGRAPLPGVSRRREASSARAALFGAGERRLEVASYSVRASDVGEAAPSGEVPVIGLSGSVTGVWVCTAAGRTTATWLVSLRGALERACGERLGAGEARGGEAEAERSPSGG